MDRVPTRLPLVLAIVPTLALTFVRADEPRPVSRQGRVQAAATSDGFLVLERSPLQRLVTIGRDGGAGEQVHLPRLPVDARAVGLKSGEHVLVYQAGKRVQVDSIDDGGELTKLTEFGKRVDHLCDGVASNEHRFGVAWTEADGAVWFVHGPTGGAIAMTADEQRASTDGDVARQPSYCGIASAGEQIALLWQDGGNIHVNFCNERRCSRAARVALPANRQVRAFGCTRSACAVAAKTPDGSTELSWIGANGKRKWSKRLDAASGSAFSVVGVAQQSIAIGHMLGGSDAGIAVADETGKLGLVWTGTADGTPWLVWSKDRLLFALQRHGELAIGILKRDRDQLVVEPPR